MRKAGYSIFFATAMVLMLGLPVMKGETATISERKNDQIEEIIPTYESTVNVSHSFSFSGNQANLAVNVSAPSSKNVSITMILQRKDGSSWTKIKQWTKEGKGRQTLAKSTTVTKVRTYRMKYTVTVCSEVIKNKSAAKTA